MAMITLISRVVGVHKLLLLNFYPFLQRYLQPHQRDVTTLLAALIQVSTCPDAFKALQHRITCILSELLIVSDALALGLVHAAVRGACCRCASNVPAVSHCRCHVFSLCERDMPDDLWLRCRPAMSWFPQMR